MENQILAPSDLKRIRKDTLGMTQEALGSALGRSARNIYRYENGTLPVPPVVAYAVMWLAIFGPASLSFSPTGAPIAPVRNAVGD